MYLKIFIFTLAQYDNFPDQQNSCNVSFGSSVKQKSAHLYSSTGLVCYILICSYQNYTAVEVPGPPVSNPKQQMLCTICVCVYKIKILSYMVV